MNPPIRRRLPPSVRRLLTDIGPKEDWAEAGGGSVLTESADGESTAQTRALCMLCKCKASCYSCPRCNRPYCGLDCYRSRAHSACSEEFYKECVLKELKEMGRTDADQKKNIQEVLVRLKRQAENTAGGMEALLKKAAVGLEEKVEVMVLLSRLAELQQSGKGHENDMEAIVRKLEEMGDDGDEDEDEMTHWRLDLAERLAQMDVDKLSEQELWEILSQEEKEGFIGLTKSGALDRLVPLWTPWWENHYEGTLVEEVKKEVVKEPGDQGSEGQLCNTEKTLSVAFSNVPPLSTKIPRLSSLCSSPSPLICFSLVNAIFVYVFTMALLNGDTDSQMFDFCDIILALSGAFDCSRVFTSIQQAVAAAEALMQREGYMDREDPWAPARALEGTAHILSGRDPKDSCGYCLAALSQLRSEFSQAGSALPKEEGERRRRYFLARKKCEFFQAWVLENEHEIQRTAVELWIEHKKRESVRKGLEKERVTVEHHMETVKRRGDSVIIQEVSPPGLSTFDQIN